MKGLILFVFCLALAITWEAHAGQKITAKKIVTSIELSTGEIIGNLSLQESDKVLKSLDTNENLEIRGLVIYPETIEKLVVKKLTTKRLSEKKPDQGGYN